MVEEDQDLSIKPVHTSGNSCNFYANVILGSGKRTKKTRTLLGAVFGPAGLYLSMTFRAGSRQVTFGFGLMSQHRDMRDNVTGPNFFFTFL